MKGTRIGEESAFAVERFARSTISMRRSNSEATAAFDIKPATASTSTRHAKISKTAVLKAKCHSRSIWVRSVAPLGAPRGSAAIEGARRVMAANPIKRKIMAKNEVRGEMKLVAGAITSRLHSEIIHQKPPRFKRSGISSGTPRTPKCSKMKTSPTNQMFLPVVPVPNSKKAPGTYSTIRSITSNTLGLAIFAIRA